MVKIEDGRRVCYSDLSGERICEYKGYGRPPKFTAAEKKALEKKRRQARAAGKAKRPAAKPEGAAKFM